uniref:Reverse transcriptase zinc-binding domain-containing protein n=1 Tax=Arundo donax TaxID=35708 RepID=A0A0A9B5C6_ARUDO
MRQEYGGLGVPYLRDLNICLLASWIKRYIKDDDKLWKQLIDHKYKSDRPNIFACKDSSSSQFWKGILWAARVAKMGYRWQVGKRNKIRFWEDNWVGTSSLPIQYWDLYVLVNGQTASIAEIWDGQNLRCTFRRCVDSRFMQLWEELV